MERAAATFIKHFANANRTKRMNILRSKAKPERQRRTFSTGRRTSIGFEVRLCGAYENIGFRFLGWMCFLSYSGSCRYHSNAESLAGGRPEATHEYYVPSL